jgi:hypothetical protein
LTHSRRGLSVKRAWGESGWARAIEHLPDYVERGQAFAGDPTDDQLALFG